MFILQKINNFLYGTKYHTNYFHNCIHAYRKVENYLAVYNFFYRKNIFLETAKEINHNSKITFGTSLLYTKKALKIPFRLVKNSSISDIIFYETRIGSYKIIVELHFFNKKLVFFKHVFPSKTDRAIISDYIRQKYLFNKNEIDLTNQIIIDENKSFLSIENDVYLSVYYLTFKFGFYDFLINKNKEMEIQSNVKENLVLSKLLEHL